MTDWIAGVFIYVEKLWHFFYCFWDHLKAQGLDMVLGVYRGGIALIAGLLAAIPMPDALMNWSYPSLPTPIAWAIYDLQLPLCLALIVGGATIRVTRSTLKMLH